ncbi:MAG TPA: DUF5677 domain-containing protein [Bacteroidia bacterium]|jgi:hypothetical protein|nr:DUF5677 domain-containing protein [Bacteroidia bacterium]
MEKLPDINKEFLAIEAKKIIDFANANIEQLNGKCQKKDTTQDYFLGILRRQTIILYDLIALLKNSPHKNFTSLFILCRCLIDDFLFVFYLKTQPDEDENIVRINANAYSKSFQGLEILTESNEKHFNGTYPFYLNKEEFSKLKEHFKSKAENEKYFKDREKFNFKAFLQVTQIADKTEDFELSKLTLRAFFLWKNFSDFIHYSNLTFELEMNTGNEQNYLRQIEETLLYSFNTVELSFRYFAKRDNIKLKVEEELQKRYIIKYK